MFVKLLDRDTQKTVDASLFSDASVYHWTEGNGSCDCNRILEFNDVDELKYHHEIGVHVMECLGNRRFLVVDVWGDLEGRTKAEIIAAANDLYIE